MMLVASLLLAHAAGVLGTLFTAMSVSTWYAFILKPEFAPPDFIFAPVWLTLYTLMAFALYLVWRESTWRTDVKWGLRWYLMQLGLNALWSILFFGLQSPLYGLICIAALLVSIAITMYFFFRVNTLAGALLIPYIVWVGFATFLNYAIWVLN